MKKLLGIATFLLLFLGMMTLGSRPASAAAPYLLISSDLAPVSNAALKETTGQVLAFDYIQANGQPVFYNLFVSTGLPSSPVYYYCMEGISMAATPSVLTIEAYAQRCASNGCTEGKEVLEFTKDSLALQFYPALFSPKGVYEGISTQATAQARLFQVVQSGYWRGNF